MISIYKVRLIFTLIVYADMLPGSHFFIPVKISASTATSFIVHFPCALRIILFGFGTFNILPASAN